MGKKRKQGNMSPQKAHNLRIEDLVNSEGDEFPVAEVRRMMIKMFNEFNEEFKEDIQKHSMNPKRTQMKKSR
jgi:hypothetical protein